MTNGQTERVRGLRARLRTRIRALARRSLTPEQRGKLAVLREVERELTAMLPVTVTAGQVARHSEV